MEKLESNGSCHPHVRDGETIQLKLLHVATCGTLRLSHLYPVLNYYLINSFVVLYVISH